MVTHASDQASALLHRGTDAVRETSRQLRQRAANASDATVGYIQHEPIKSVLVAAAIGAGLMGLVSLMGRSSTSD